MPKANPSVSDFDPPPGQYRDSIDDLRRRANAGDAQAAYTLSRVLIDCFLLGQGKATTYGSDLPDRCEGLSVTDSKEAIHWMQVAADRGLLDAQLMYADTVAYLLTPTDMIRDPAMVQDYKTRSMAYLNSAAMQGSASAMSQLANAYFRGITTERNLQLAYAYYYASSMFNLSAVIDDPKNIYGGNLSSDQIAAARALGAKIYNQCCG